MKHLFILAALTVPFAMHAQNSAVVSAYNYMGDGDYDKAELIYGTIDRLISVLIWMTRR